MSDVQHEAAAERTVTTWRRSVACADGTHHVIDGVPMYGARFRLVREFHEPGLAPAHDRAGAFHIDASGSPAYSRRFREAWGFYDSLAAVQHDDGSWSHVRTDGSTLGAQRYDWCGNFQERRCTVRSTDGLYRHIDTDGGLVYDTGHLYAGDFREQAAVVRCADDALCGHIDAGGRPLHPRRFIDLDVFHKGYARARDSRGWFHIRRDGTDAYQARFAQVEPFYNGTAFAETLGADRVLITPAGAVARVIAEGSRITRQPH